MGSDYFVDFHSFSDNRPLDEGRYESMLEGIATIERAHWRTRDFVEETGLDKGTFLPGNVWKSFCDLDSFNKWPYAFANICKVLSPFTGHYMALWGRVDQGHLEQSLVDRFYHDLFTGGVPEDLDSILKRDYGLWDRVLKYSDPLLDSYDRLLDSVCSRYWVPTPLCMGEIGIRHRGTIVNYDIETYQGRVNALAGCGVIGTLEEKCIRSGRVRVLEIGPGHCYMAYALSFVLGEKAQFFLVDLPRSLVHGYIYLVGLFGSDCVQIVSEETEVVEDKRFVLIPNYLLPRFEDQVVGLDLSINAISLNEMNVAQNEYYMEFVLSHSNLDAVFHMERGGHYIEEHTDSLLLAKMIFPRYEDFGERTIGHAAVVNSPNSFFYMK